VAEDGVVTVYTGKTEVGQNTRTSLSQAVAEELRVPVASVRMVMADTDLTPFDQGTFGSRSTPAMAPQLRRAAAAAREALVELAAERLQVERSAVQVADGRVVHGPTGRSLSFGELTRGQKLTRSIPGDVAVTPAAEWKTSGQSVRKADGRAFVTGRHRYSTDVKLPGMLCGKVLRAPALGAEMVSLDASAAERQAGVVVVRDGGFAGVVAPNEHLASQALAALKAEWKTAPQPSSAELWDHLKKHAGEVRPAPAAVRAALEGADRKLSATYTVAYIAHAPLEPRAAVAEWRDGKLTVWTGTQRPFGVRGELARAFNIPEDRVRVIVPDTGSGYGGKHTGEAAVEAARLAKAAGKPVRVVWTREEEFTWAYFRPAGVIEAAGGATKDGALAAWEFHNYNSGGSAIRTPYEVAAQHIEFHRTDSPLRQGSYRALASTANNFARESHMDDLAHAVGIDPLAFRLKNLKDTRMIAVLQAAADRFGWASRKTGPDRASGLACGFEKGGYVATCAEVTIDRAAGRVKVPRVVAAFECGAVVNPDHLKNQVEGCIVQGLGGALFEAIDFQDGKIGNPRFSRYRVPRFSDAPAIEVVLVDRKDLPSAGAGESPIIGIAPAVGNAVFAATGVRLRSLPMVRNGLKL
jgi:isoquinoline 1-oxidoreductase